MKFGQLVEHLKRKWGRETSSRLLSVFYKSFTLGKSKGSAAWFHYISIALQLAYNRNKLLKTLHCWSRDMVNFDFLDKGLGIHSPASLVHDFSQKKCSSRYILLTDQISLPGSFGSWYFGQYVHCNCLLPRLWHHGFWN